MKKKTRLFYDGMVYYYYVNEKVYVLKKLVIPTIKRNLIKAAIPARTGT